MATTEIIYDGSIIKVQDLPPQLQQTIEWYDKAVLKMKDLETEINIASAAVQYLHISINTGVQQYRTSTTQAGVTPENVDNIKTPSDYLTQHIVGFEK